MKTQDEKYIQMKLATEAKVAVMVGTCQHSSDLHMFLESGATEELLASHTADEASPTQHTRNLCGFSGGRWVLFDTVH